MNRFWIFLAIALLGLASCASKPSKTLTEKTVHDASALKTSAVQLTPVVVEFQAYWIKEQRHQHSQQEINQLQQRFSEALTRAAHKQLTAQGWVIDTSAELKLNLKLTNTRINAPDFGGAMTQQYVQGDELGSAHFELDILKGGALAIQAKDARKATFGAPLEWTETNFGINQQAFNRALSRFIIDALSTDAPKNAH
jgi:hypothetical protein